MNRCLEPEILAAYVDQGLSLAERARIEAHLASCPSCVAMVAGVVRTIEAVSGFVPIAEVSVEASPHADRRTVVGVLAAAAAVLVVVALPSLLRPWPDRDTGLVSLADTVGGERSVLGRLTGGLPHAPLGVPSAGGQGGQAAEADRIVLTAGKIRESFGERGTPSRLHALGVQQLLAGRYDDAAQSLLAAAREQPDNARYVNDVAAVQLERARLGLRPDDLPRALAAADRARRLDPSLREAWFNRALAATALSLNAQAKEAWADYLARDSGSPWAAEARTRVEELSRPTPAASWAGIAQQLNGHIDASLADQAVRTQTTEARNFVENELLPKWAAAAAAGRDASRELDRVRHMADAFGRITGDSLYRDTVSAVDSADARGGDSVARLARAHSQYAAGAALYREDRFAEAAPGLTTARAALLSANSPFAARPGLDLATILYVSGKPDEALAVLDALLVTARKNGYAYNVARAVWVQALIAFGQSRLADAQGSYEEMLASFERMGDAEGVANAHNLLAALHFYLGDRTREWHHRLLAFAGLDISTSPRFRHAVLGTAAAALRADSPETALVIQDAVLQNAREWGREAAIAETLSQRGSVFLALGRTDEAQRDLAGARISLRSIPDERFRDRIEVALLATESDVLRRTDPQGAVAAATRAIELVNQRRDRLRLAQLNLKLAKANIAWGRIGEAQAALDRGIRAFEDERASLSDEGRISTLDESWQLFETSVQLAVKNKDYPRAFDLAERARSRTLAAGKRVQIARSLADIERSLEPSEAVVALNQFDDELAVWVVTRRGTKVVTRPITKPDARRLIARQQDEILHQSRRPDASADLYNEILRPLAGELVGISRLVVVPDAHYQDTSFAGLWDTAKGRFLVENVDVTLAPSISASATAKAAARVVSDSPSPFVLGGPHASADANARAVAAVYESPEILTGPLATRSRFMADAPSRAIVHLAAQTSGNQAYPLLSRVLLADEPGRRYSGTLLGRDIAARGMPQTRLVVIDEIDRTNRSEGSLSLALAFMAAGVPAVLGTLPGADEGATGQLMLDFHRLMSKGISAEKALSTLQRNVLQSNGRRLGAWSALVLYGSDR